MLFNISSNPTTVSYTHCTQMGICQYLSHVSSCWIVSDTRIKQYFTRIKQYTFLQYTQYTGAVQAAINLVLQAAFTERLQALLLAQPSVCFTV